VLLSGAFLLLLILAGIIIAVSGSGGGHHTTTKPPVAQGSTTSSSTPAANSTACTLPAGDQTIPAASPPAGTQWVQVGSMAAPQAPGLYGPQHTRGIWNYCFAHNPSGALLAAVNFWAEGTAASATQVLHHLSTGPIPQSALGNDRLDAAGPVQLVGYRYGSYQPSTAQIFVALKGPQGKLGSILTTMKWTDGDWRFAVPPTGTPALAPISDLTGYVSWSSF
jgi:hypothetical protein